MNSVEYVKRVCRERGISIAKLERECGFSNGYIGGLRKGTFPSDRLQKIADYLDLPIQEILFPQEVQISGQLPYYIDDEAKEIAQELKDNPELRALMDAARKKDKETLVTVTNLLYLMKGTNPDG